MERIDKLLSKLNIASRKEAKTLIKKGLILADGVKITSADMKVSENAVISYSGKEYTYQKYRYFLMNKPSGYLSANKDPKDKTVMDIFVEKYPDIKASEYFLMGRLDKDTVGLLIITNDGDLTHRLLSPKYHVEKTYYVKLDTPINESIKKKIEDGVYIEKDVLTKPSKIEILNDEMTECNITIVEGRFHQVKKMFSLNGSNVTYLKRIKFGKLILPQSLKEGDITELSHEEIELLKNEN